VNDAVPLPAINELALMLATFLRFLDESRTIVFATSSPFLTLNVLFVVFPDI
jgi:hypothetical protein